MSSRLGPMDLDCDAPLYSVVKACEGLGFQSPLDVRWCRRSHVLGGQRELGGVVGFHPFQWLFGGSQRPKTICTCGQPLPLMERFTFTFASEKEADYLLGQCCRCRTMYWEEASVPSRKETESGSEEICCLQGCSATECWNCTFPRWKQAQHLSIQAK